MIARTFFPILAHTFFPILCRFFMLLVSYFPSSILGKNSPLSIFLGPLHQNLHIGKKIGSNRLSFLILKSSWVSFSRAYNHPLFMFCTFYISVFQLWLFPISNCASSPKSHKHTPILLFSSLNLISSFHSRYLHVLKCVIEKNAQTKIH